MVWLQASGQVLGAEHLEVFINLEGFRFSVQVVDGSHHDASRGDAEGRILNCLQFRSRGWTGIWKPDGCSVSEE